MAVSYGNLRSFFFPGSVFFYSQMRRVLLLLAVASSGDTSKAAAEDAGATALPLLADRSWFTQIARFQPQAPLQPGTGIEGYELVERTAVLGMCNHQPQAAFTSRALAPTGEVDALLPSSNGDAATAIAAPVSDESSDPIHQQLAQLGPTLEYQCLLKKDPALLYVNANYRLRTQFEAGSHGEVWRATRRGSPAHEQFILKRLFVHLSAGMVEMGLREAHFGTLLAKELHVTRFVESFFRPVSQETPTSEETQELWLVFYDEGMSLRHYLYTKQPTTSASVIMTRSRFWESLRANDQGELVLREIMRQVLQGVAALHARGITHRDLKPSNILLTLGTTNESLDENADNAPRRLATPIVKLADFGSAVDEYTLRHLYTHGAPSQAEETREYQPPEVLLNEFGRPYDYVQPMTYDLWSLGVLFLEMVLGSPQVFLISTRARTKLDLKLQGKDDQTKRKSYWLHVLTHEFCIFQPAPHQLSALWNKYAVVTDGCHFGRFNASVIERDPLRKGLASPWALDLIWKLLQWDPAKRIPAADALQHAFFQGDEAYKCQMTGRTFATSQELELHVSYLRVQTQREQELASMVVREKFDPPTAFKCPHCHRSFATVSSCEQHLHARKHHVAAGTHFCQYESAALALGVQEETNASLSASLLLSNHVGGVLFQGRRKYMEDFVVMETNRELAFDLYAVTDGHLGTGAATYVTTHLFDVLTKHLAAVPSTQDDDTNSPQRAFAEQVALRQTFLELHDGFINTTRSTPDDFSGCTLSVILYFPKTGRLVSANVGDSRAILIQDLGHEADQTIVSSLTTDHWPHIPSECERIESSGGFVSFSGLWRVVGQLAVSRSLGDRHLRQYVTAEPSIVQINLLEQLHGRTYIVLASDGLWETMTNHDVEQFLSERLSGTQGDDLNAIAQQLLIESYVRGSLDNLAVVVVALPIAVD